MSERRESYDELSDPEVMFLPLAAPADGDWQDLDAGVLARRIPDFVHQVLNRGMSGPTAMLELQSAGESGPVTWVQMDAPPDREDAFELLPSEVRVHAIVCGGLEPVAGGLQLEFHVYRSEDEEGLVTEKVAGLLPFEDPVTSLLRMTRRLARLLSIPFQEPPLGLLTKNGDAFRCFLRGLDNAMLLSGDLEIAMPKDRMAMIQPFVDALTIDPTFGFALRMANATVAFAVRGARLSENAVCRFLDQCLATKPGDGEGCVAIAEQLSEMGDDDRALAWLEHAAQLDPPSSRGLESLGILHARRGDVAGARELWQQALAVDGHPDFESHLAQLCFVEGADDAAWAHVLHGLRRLRERTLRAAEFDDAGRGPGILLECLQMHLAKRRAPRDVADALRDLHTLLIGEARLHLGLCLFACGMPREARVELLAGLRDVADATLRDRAVRAMLQIDVADFEARFAKATERSLRGRSPKSALAEFQLWLHLQPEFWPALYYSGIIKRRCGAPIEALDLLAAALEIAPGQPDVLFEMAELFARRQNPKRALELLEQAIAQRGGESRLHAARVRYLRDLSRVDDAREAVDVAVAAGLDSPELRKLARQLTRI